MFKQIIIPIVVLSGLLVACEKMDVREQAADIMYEHCIKNGQTQNWCRCIKAELLLNKNNFNEDVAILVTKNRVHPWLHFAMQSAQLRCECQFRPERLASYGLSCEGVEPIKY